MFYNPKRRVSKNPGIHKLENPQSCGSGPRPHAKTEVQASCIQQWVETSKRGSDLIDY
jgi:hypothetical protein